MTAESTMGLRVRYLQSLAILLAWHFAILQPKPYCLLGMDWIEPSGDPNPFAYHIPDVQSVYLPCWCPHFTPADRCTSQASYVSSGGFKTVYGRHDISISSLLGDCPNNVKQPKKKYLQHR